MKSAVEHLEPHMEKSEARARARADSDRHGEGRCHDIGKNLVDIILTNNGYEVINLGIKQSCEAIVEAQQEHQADCIAMSGLLVKSTAFMKDNLRPSTPGSCYVILERCGPDATLCAEGLPRGLRRQGDRP